MGGIGHNSGAFGDDPCEAIETVLDDDTKKLFHYVQWHLADYITGTQGMSPEQEGIYIRFLVRLYDRGKPFPDDDRFMSSLMSLDVRRWRRVKVDLVTYGKITVRAGALTNSRFEKERQKRAAELRRQADATAKYWERKRSEKETSEESRGEVGAKSVESPREVQATFVEKPKEIKETAQHPTLQTRDQRLETREEERESPDGLLSPDPGQDDGRMTASKAAKMAFDLYNETARRCGIPQCRILNDARKRALALRVREAGGIDGFKQALANLEKSAYCRGENERGWVATIDYVCQPKGFAKLFEGGWGNGAHAKPTVDTSKYDHFYDGVL